MAIPDHSFKGNLDVDALRSLIDIRGVEAISSVRMEAGTSLIGGQPFSVQNLREVSQVWCVHGIPLVLDASLLADNLYFNTYGGMSVRDMKATTVGLEETMDEDMINQGPQFIGYMVTVLAAALYVCSGVRGMERGTMSEARDAEGAEPLADMELVRLAMPRRVFTLSQVNYVIHRLGGLEWEEADILRFFYGRLKPKSGWSDTLVATFRGDFGDSL